MNAKEQKRLHAMEIALDGKLTEEVVEDMTPKERLNMARNIIRQAGGWFYQDTYHLSGVISLKIQGNYRMKALEVHETVKMLCYRVTYTTKNTRYSSAGTPRYQFINC